MTEHFEDMHVELFHLKDDLGEKSDLAAGNPRKTEELRRMLHQWRSDVGAQMPVKR